MAALQARLEVGRKERLHRQQVARWIKTALVCTGELASIVTALHISPYVGDNASSERE